MDKKKTPTSLLSEIDRQRKCLDELPKQYSFPLFSTRHAIESQRHSGYKTTAAAAREIVDNAIEAGATKIHVIFKRPDKLKKSERADSVAAIAFIDNGSGMIPKMTQYALSWGGGTHFDDPKFIGKFGFGLPNASINQTRQVEVYSRTQTTESFSKSSLDIRNPPEHEEMRVPDPVEAALPEFVAEYLERIGEPLDHGTVVVWHTPDRLTYRMAAPLKELLVDDFGVTYRYLLDGREVIVEGVKVEPVDPLFLTPGARLYIPPEQGGAQEITKRSIAVRYVQEADGSMHLQKVDDPAELAAAEVRAVGTLVVTIARFPDGLVENKKKENPDGFKRLQIRKPRRGMSFVRSNREIETADVFPKTPRDEANKLGIWPLLQGYAYHWGCEVKFEPGLDEPIGIGNDKQTVRPGEDFWRILAAEGIDRLLMKENEWQRVQRKKPAVVGPSPVPTDAELAVTAADAAMGKPPRVPERLRESATTALEKAAKARAEVTKETLDTAIDALDKEAKRRKVIVDYVDSPHGPFYVPEFRGDLVVANINRSHPFYQMVYGELVKLPGGNKAKQAIDVLLLTLAKAELMTDSHDMGLWYDAQRTTVWSPGLALALKELDQRLEKGEEEEDMQEEAS